jgi:MFS family permease
LSGTTGAVAIWLYLSVPEKPGTPHPEPLSSQWSGIRQVLGSRHFWRFVPLGAAQIGGFMAVQSLWSSAWMMQVNGFSRTLAANHLSAMSAAMIVSYALIGLLATRLARRGIAPIYLLGGGIAMAQLILLLIITQAFEQHYLLWIAYGVFSSFGTLAYAVMSAGFPVALSGRANTTYNLMVFIGAFSLQWGMGVLIEWLEVSGHSTATAHHHAFVALFLLQTAASVWLLSGRQTPKRQLSPIADG